MLKLLISLALFLTIKADIFTSLYKMEQLIVSQEAIVKSLEDYLIKEKERLSEVERYLQNMKGEYVEATSDTKLFLGNPIKCYTLIKRQSIDLNYIEQVINKTTEYRRNYTVIYPKYDDFLGVLEAMHRIQSTYKLNITHLAINGIIKEGYGFSKPLTASDCLEIGRSLYQDKNYNTNILWLKESLKKFNSGDNFVNVTEDFIVDYISHAYYILDDVENTILWTKRLIELRPDHHEVPLYKRIISEFEKRLASGQLEKQTKTTQENERNESLEKVIKTLHKKDALCRGENKLDPNLTKRLKCRYKLGPDPFLSIAPFKMEQLHDNPEVFLFHDVITDDEIEIAIELAKPKLIRGKVGSREKGRFDDAPYRITQIAWLPDNTSEVLAKLSKRVNHFTDLDMEFSESIQVANYGVGGHYEPHFDFLYKNGMIGENDNRQATVIFYLTDVEQGGATAFTKLGITVFPRKGSALFWNNMLPSGEGDTRTLHTACPVLLGFKWIATKWISSFGQDRRYFKRA